MSSIDASFGRSRLLNWKHVGHLGQGQSRVPLRFSSRFLKDSALAWTDHVPAANRRRKRFRRHSLEHELAGFVVEDLPRNGVELHARLHSRGSLPGPAGGNRRTKVRSVLVASESHLAFDLARQVLVDELEIGRLSAETRTVVDDLRRQLFRCVIEQYHREFPSDFAPRPQFGNIVPTLPRVKRPRALFPVGKPLFQGGFGDRISDRACHACRGTRGVMEQRRSRSFVSDRSRFGDGHEKCIRLGSLQNRRKLGGWVPVWGREEESESRLGRSGGGADRRMFLDPAIQCRRGNLDSQRRRGPRRRKSRIRSQALPGQRAHKDEWGSPSELQFGGPPVSFHFFAGLLAIRR